MRCPGLIALPIVLALAGAGCEESLEKKLEGTWSGLHTPMRPLPPPEKGSLRASKDPLTRGIGRFLARSETVQPGAQIRRGTESIEIRGGKIVLGRFFVGFGGKWSDAKPTPFRVLDRERIEITTQKGALTVTVRLSDDGEGLTLCPERPLLPAVSTVGYLFDWDIRKGQYGDEKNLGVLCDPTRFGTPHRFSRSAR